MTLRVCEAWQAATFRREKCHGEKCHRRRKVQVPVHGLLCEVSGDCQAVLRTLLDREVRGRLITIQRGKGEVLYIALCCLWSWVSSTERGISKGCW